MTSDVGISPEIEAYVSRFGMREHPALKRCREETQANHPGRYMQIGEDQGALIALDNMLWSGGVADPSNKEESTVVIGALNTKIHADNRVDMALATIADGILLVCS